MRTIGHSPGVPIAEAVGSFVFAFLPVRVELVSSSTWAVWDLGIFILLREKFQGLARPALDAAARKGIHCFGSNGGRSSVEKLESYIGQGAPNHHELMNPHLHR